MKKIVLMILIICSACSVDLEEEATADPIFCTEEVRNGLEITVKSNVSETTLSGDLITVEAKDGAYTETLQNLSNSTTFLGAFEREGSYLITVSGEGYKTYTSSSPIIVESDICHVITENHEIELMPN